MPALSAKDRPVFRGLHWHRHANYSFFIPIDWCRFAHDDGRDGVLYGPDPQNPQTSFGADLLDLGFEIRPEDAAPLAEGFFSAIEALPGFCLESREQEQLAGPRIHLQARFTFEEDGHTRKRWLRALYRHHFQVMLTAQGATPERFAYWLPAFFEAMMTAAVHLRQPQEEDLA